MPNALQITDPNSDNPLAQAPSWADAAQSVAGTVGSGVDALGQWLAAQRAKSSQLGLWDDRTGLPTGKGLVSAAQQTGNALLMGTTAPGIRAFHGSAADFNRFGDEFIGTGEGNQSYGYGHYFGGAEGTGRAYRDADVARKELGVTDPASGRVYNPGDPYYEDAVKMYGSPGKMYEVGINADPEQFLHWDQTVGQHPPAVRDKLLDMGYGDTDRGADVYSHMARGKEGDVGASKRLLDAGIPGIRYLDQGSRGAGEGTHNTVVFDANTIDILRKYGIAGLGLGLGAAAGTQGQPRQ